MAWTAAAVAAIHCTMNGWMTKERRVLCRGMFPIWSVFWNGYGLANPVSHCTDPGTPTLMVCVHYVRSCAHSPGEDRWRRRSASVWNREFRLWFRIKFQLNCDTRTLESDVRFLWNLLINSITIENSLYTLRLNWTCPSHKTIDIGHGNPIEPLGLIAGDLRSVCFHSHFTVIGLDWKHAHSGGSGPWFDLIILAILHFTCPHTAGFPTHSLTHSGLTMNRVLENLIWVLRCLCSCQPVSQLVSQTDRLQSIKPRAESWSSNGIENDSIYSFRYIDLWFGWNGWNPELRQPTQAQWNAI